jgi:CubicO group peptidase (beta-lactamase class C family)
MYNIRHAGVSVGILHQNEVIYTANFGVRDVAASTTPDENTIYHLGSVTKAFSAAAMGILVEEQKTNWDTVVSSILPDFKHRDPVIRGNAKITDIMAHRTVTASTNALWMQEFGRLSLSKDQTLATASALYPVRDFRSKWLYGNWGYLIAAEIIEKLSGRRWGQFLKTHIFEPLGMNRTKTVSYPETDNIVQGFMTLAEGSPLPLNERPHLAWGQISKVPWQFSLVFTICWSFTRRS